MDLGGRNGNAAAVGGRMSRAAPPGDNRVQEGRCHVKFGLMYLFSEFGNIPDAHPRERAFTCDSIDAASVDRGDVHRARITAAVLDPNKILIFRSWRTAERELT